MTLEDDGLTQRQRRAAILLAAGWSVAATAKKAGVSARSIYDWQSANEPFKLHAADLRGRMLARACGRLARAATKASRTLDRLLDDANPQVALRAAVAVLEHGVRLRDHVELDARLCAIEAAAEAAKTGVETWH